MAVQVLIRVSATIAFAPVRAYMDPTLPRLFHEPGSRERSLRSQLELPERPSLFLKQEMACDHTAGHMVRDVRHAGLHYFYFQFQIHLTHFQKDSWNHLLCISGNAIAYRIFFQRIEYIYLKNANLLATYVKPQVNAVFSPECVW